MSDRAHIFPGRHKHGEEGRCTTHAVECVEDGREGCVMVAGDGRFHRGQVFCRMSNVGMGEGKGTRLSYTSLM